MCLVLVVRMEFMWLLMLVVLGRVLSVFFVCVCSVFRFMVVISVFGFGFVLVEFFIGRCMSILVFNVLMCLVIWVVCDLKGKMVKVIGMLSVMKWLM